MEKIKVQQTSVSPKISLDSESGLFEFEGHSVITDADVFYVPILNWIEEYSKSPKIYTELILKLKCLNSASVRIFNKIIGIMEDIYLNDKQVVIHWFYSDEDHDMMEFGEELQENYNLPIFVTNQEMAI